MVFTMTAVKPKGAQGRNNYQIDSYLYLCTKR